MRADEAEPVPYTPGDLRAWTGKLERRKISTGELYELGERLAALLLPGRVRALFDASLARLGPGEGLRLRLRIEPLPLAALPWEYTALPQTHGERQPTDFLALRRRVSLVRYETIGAPLDPPAGHRALRVVIALANPIDAPELDLEADERAITAALETLRNGAPDHVVRTEVLNPASREALLAALPGADLFHFAGHGAFEGTELTPGGQIRRRGRILLENPDHTTDRLDSAELAVLLSESGVRLAVLGACQSAARDEGGAWTGVAPALVRENLPAVVAMQFRVNDRNAATFLAHLYARVLGGYSVDEAVGEGRRAVLLRSGLENRDWGTPVLYLRAENGVLFPLPPAEAAREDDPSLVVRRKLRTVRGEAIGAEIDAIFRGRVAVDEEIDTVEAGGKSVGVKVRRLGGPEDDEE